MRVTPKRSLSVIRNLLKTSAVGFRFVRVNKIISSFIIQVPDSLTGLYWTGKSRRTSIIVKKSILKHSYISIHSTYQYTVISKRLDIVYKSH